MAAKRTGTEICVRREMGVTHAEFMRTLPSATAGLPQSREAGHIRIAVGPGTVNIELGPEAKRRIGSLAVPTTAVTLRFSGFTTKQVQQFLERFDRSFHRGGG